jgi:hypothetical protein
VILTVWQKDPVQGKIVKLDDRTQMIHVENRMGITKAKFMDILKVESAPQY